MTNKLHSIDIEPRNGSHYLLVNGAVIARFDDLAKALAVREQTINDAINNSISSLFETPFTIVKLR